MDEDFFYIDDGIIIEEWFMLEYNPDIVHYNTKKTESSQFCGPQSCELCKLVVSLQSENKNPQDDEKSFCIWRCR